MDAYELVKSAGDMMANEPAAAVAMVVSSAGGFIAKEAGKIALGVLIRPSIEDMLNRFQNAKNAGKVAEDFEKTDHGAALLQEALNALLEGLDHERAEAVKKLFLGLAKTPVKNSMERVQQLEIMRIASELTAWEVVLINALERYSKSFLDTVCAAEYENERDDKRRGEIRQLATKQYQPLEDWLLRKICSGDKTHYISLRNAIDSLHKKRILSYPISGMNDMAKACTYLRKGAFSDLGWKLAVHLYSATED